MVQGGNRGAALRESVPCKKIQIGGQRPTGFIFILSLGGNVEKQGDWIARPCPPLSFVIMLVDHFVFLFLKNFLHPAFWVVFQCK